MLNVATPFPHVGSYGFLDDQAPDGRYVVERIRILSAPDRDGRVLISLEGRRYPHEVASGNRTVPLALVRETERAETIAAQAKPAGRKRSRRR